MTRRPPPPGLVAAAEQDHAAMRHALADLVPTVRSLLAGEFTEAEVLTEVWLTLLCQPIRPAALFGAAAIVELAKQPSDRSPPCPTSTDIPAGSQDHHSLTATGAADAADGDLRPATWQTRAHTCCPVVTPPGLSPSRR